MMVAGVARDRHEHVTRWAELTVDIPMDRQTLIHNYAK
jgi:hypothetical protein